eukprot:6175600-Pleurochrysis_carterae.AAC.3
MPDTPALVAICGRTQCAARRTQIYATVTAIVSRGVNRIPHLVKLCISARRLTRAPDECQWLARFHRQARKFTG